MSATITETITVNNIIKEQFLSANFDEMERIQNASKKVNIFCKISNIYQNYLE